MNNFPDVSEHRQQPSLHFTHQSNILRRVVEQMPLDVVRHCDG